MKSPDSLLSAELTVREALEEIRTAKFRTSIVSGGRGVIGVVNQLALQQQLEKDPEQKLEKIVEVLTFPHVHSDQGLDQALERMGANHLDVLPVVNRANIHKLEGIVTLRDVLNSYGVGEAD